MVVIWVFAGADTSSVPELVAVPKVSVPSTSFVSVVSPAMTAILPPSWLMVTLPSVWLAARPARPLSVKSPPAIVSGVAAMSEVSAALLAKSRTMAPPVTSVVPVYVLATEGFIVNVPAPCLVTASQPGLTVADNLPLKIVLVSSRPMVSVEATVPVEFRTLPPPESEPMTWPALLMSKVAPAATVSGERFGSTLPACALSVPALMIVAPP